MSTAASTPPPWARWKTDGKPGQHPEEPRHVRGSSLPGATPIHRAAHETQPVRARWSMSRDLYAGWSLLCWRTAAAGHHAHRPALRNPSARVSRFSGRWIGRPSMKGQTISTASAATPVRPSRRASWCSCSNRHRRSADPGALKTGRVHGDCAGHSHASRAIAGAPLDHPFSWPPDRPRCPRAWHRRSPARPSSPHAPAWPEP